MSPDLHHLSGAYAVDALDDAERASFEQHLAACADCRAEVAELSAAAHSLGALTEVTPPASLRSSVLSGIARVRPLPPLHEDAGKPAPVVTAPAADSPATSLDDALAGTAGGAASGSTGPTSTEISGEPEPGTNVVPIRRRRTAWFAAAAAAAVVAIGGVAWSPWSDDSSSTSPMAQVVAASDAMRMTSAKGGMTAEVAYSRQLGKAAIDVTGLPPAPDGKTYQLWYVGPDQVARSAGLLDADAEGHGSLLLQGDANRAAAVGMTVEPAGGSARPTTDPVLVIALA
jgi:anti-sigma-K factor RskA